MEWRTTDRMIYYTSDLHLGHANVIRHRNRPFSSVEEMDAVLISNWNKKVHKNDTVYIVGDFIFRNTLPTEQYLVQLKGKKHLIVGNHDKQWMKQIDSVQFFESISPMLTIHDCEYLVTLCHYPLMTWPGGKDAYMVFGHIHNNRDLDFWPLIAAKDHMLNAGVDVNGFAPVSLDEMKVNNKSFKEGPHDDGS